MLCTVQSRSVGVCNDVPPTTLCCAVQRSAVLGAWVLSPPRRRDNPPAAQVIRPLSLFLSTYVRACVNSFIFLNEEEEAKKNTLSDIQEDSGKGQLLRHLGLSTFLARSLVRSAAGGRITLYFAQCSRC